MLHDSLAIVPISFEHVSSAAIGLGPWDWPRIASSGRLESKGRYLVHSMNYGLGLGGQQTVAATCHHLPDFNLGVLTGTQAFGTLHEASAFGFFTHGNPQGFSFNGSL